MPRNIVDAADIRPGQKGWTCTIQVVQRHPVLHKELTYFPFQKRYRHYLLTDMKGTKVKAVIFDKDIDFFQRSLLPFNRYKISNATVTVQPEKYQLPDYKFSWTINARTPVEPIVDSKPYTLPCSFDVCKFSDLHRYAESDTNVAVRGLVVHRFPFIDIKDTESARDYVLVNEEEIPIVIRLWKNLLPDYDPEINSGRNNDHVAIIASNLEVKTFHGLSLATRSNTYLIQNPPVAEELDLHKWYATHKEKVAELLKNQAYENNMKFYAHPKPEEIKDLTAAMAVFENVRTCWIKAQIRLRPTRNPLYDILCANCRMEVEAGVDWDVQCSGCSVLSPMEVRLKLPVALIHNTMELRATLKSPDAEKICPFTAVEIKKHEEEGIRVAGDISVAMDNTEVVCFVKYYEKRSGGELARKYVILKMYTPDEMISFNQPTATPLHSAVQLGSQTPVTTPVAIMPPPPQCGQPSPAEKQFFSPTTKNVLAQIEKGSQEAGASSAHTSTAKRPIHFGSLSEEDLGNVSTNDPEENLAEEGSTPKKKTKAIDKN